MTRISSELRFHAAAVVLAVVAGVLTGAPSVLAPRALGDQYRGVPFLYQDNESLYLARVHDIVDGHSSLGSPILYENKDMPTALPSTGEHVYTVLASVLFLTLNQVVLLSKFVFPAIIFILAYCLAYMLAKDQGAYAARVTALAGASLVVFGADFLQINYILSLLADGGKSAAYLNEWTRLVNPTTGALFLFAYLITVWGIIKGKKYSFVFAGVILGAMTGYIFSFALACTITAVLFFALVYFRRPHAWRLVSVVLIGAVLNAFQVVNFVKVMQLPHADSFALKNGLLLTHAPLLNKFLLLALAVALMASAVRHWQPKGGVDALKDSELFAAAFFVASLIVMNQQLLTGRTIWPQHFTQYSLPISYILILVSISYIVATFATRAWQKWAWVACLCSSIVFSFGFGLRIMDSYKGVLPEYAEQQHWGPTFDWLNAHAAKDCVVFTVEPHERLAAMLPALTDCNSYEIGYVFVGIPEERIKHNYLMWMRFTGVPGDEAEEYLKAHTTEFRVLLFSDWKELFWHNGNPWLESFSDRPAIEKKYQAMATSLAVEYQQSLKRDFVTQLMQYRLDYVLWNEAEYPTWDPKRFPFLHETFASHGVHLYEVK